MINLISNAIKFSFQGDRIKVEIIHSEQSANTDRPISFKFLVTDQGLGLNEVDRKNLFQPYFRSSDETNRLCNTNSNGLGLHTCKRLAQVLNGDLTLASEYTEGCQFVLELNLEQVESPTRQLNYKYRGRKFGVSNNQKVKRSYKQSMGAILELSQEYVASIQNQTSGDSREDASAIPNYSEQLVRERIIVAED